MSFKIPRFWLFNQPKDEVLKISKIESTPSPNKKNFVHVTKDSKNKNSAIPKSDLCQESDVAVMKPKMNEGAVSLYYAVSLPSSFGNEDLLVFCDKKDALNAVKAHDGARFKTFHTKEEAVAFASCSVEVTCGTPKNNISSPSLDHEKSLNGVKYKAPKSQSTVLLRKAIVDGRIEEFQTTVWSNPRYLISCGDTPVILQEGFRYNALHVAAKHKQPELCQLILDTLEDASFIKLLYTDDSESIRLQRISYLTDLYLNMPDKRLCETPLHFASKFGCLEAVRILASHPACDKTRQNKYGLLAREIICERCPSSCIELKHQIEEAFEGQYFVPVLRCSDNSVQPSVGKPCSKKGISIPSSIETGSPKSSAVSVMAIAGPMSPEQAQKFYRRLKTPPVHLSRSKYQELNKIRLCDTEKGLERIGRDLAHDMKAQWTEYWPSLNAWCDLSSNDGLQVLEDHLRNMHHQILSQVSLICADITPPSNRKSFFDDLCPRSTLSKSCSNTTTSSSSSSGITKLCNDLENFHLFDKSNDSISSLEVPSNTANVSPGEKPDSISSGVHRNSKDKEYLSKSNLEQSELSSSCLTPKRKVQKFKETFRNNNEEFVHCDSPFKVSDKLFLPVNDDSVEELLEKCSLQFLYNLKSLSVSLFETFSLMINLDISDIEQAQEIAEDVVPELQCLLKSSQNVEEDLSYVHSFLSQQVFKDMENHFLDHENKMVVRLLKFYVDNYLSVNSLQNEDHSEDLPLQHLKCLLITYCSLSDTSPDKLNPCLCNWTLELRSEDRSCLSRKWTKENSQDEDDFYTPPTSPRFDWNSSDDEALTPSEGLEVFVEGDYPSKADVDILRAIDNVPLDYVRYPHICRWKHLISSKDQKVVESWSTPKQSENRIRSKMTRSLSCSPISPLAFSPSSKLRGRTSSFFDRLQLPE